MTTVESWECASDGTENLEVDSEYMSDEDNLFTFNKVPQLQKRKVVSKARWDADMGMAEIIENKGGMWNTTGIIRKSKVYCSIEETMFLLRLGALHVLDVNGATLSLGDLTRMAADSKTGCSWELCEAYKYLKSLGYIVGRHGVPWTMKNDKTRCDPTRIEGHHENNGISDKELEENSAITNLFSNMQINEVKLVFDVYLPNTKFRKSSPGNPSFTLCLTKGHPPSVVELEDLERKSNGIPLKFCYVEHEHVNFFSFNKTELPVLP